MGDPLQVIRANRRGIRQLGLTSQGIQCVEVYFALKAKRPRVSVADVARVLGVDRSLVSRQLARAEAVGLLVRVGRTLVLMARSLAKWSKEFVRERMEAARRKASKRWKSLAELRNRDSGSGHIGPKNLTEGQSPGEAAAACPPLSRHEALAQLRATYIPPHLRRAK